MAYRGQPQLDQDILLCQELCQKLMIPWPPNAQGIYMAVQEQKQHGSKALERNQLQEAQVYYNVALEMVIKMPLSSDIQNELPKLHCNLALIYTKQGRFQLALDAAASSIAAQPDHVKGYWRAGQAAKTMFQGENRALPYIVLGLNQSLKGYGTQDDIVSFLTELCTLIVIGSHGMQHLHQIPNIQDVSIWKKVVTRLSNNSKWYSLIMLVTVGVQGPQCKLDGRVKQLQVSCAGVSVGTLLFNRLNECVEIPKVVVQACVKFFKLGAPIDDIVERTKSPLLNIGVMTAFKSKCMDLLSYLLGVLRDVPEKRDAQDCQGLSSYHVLIQTKFIDSPLGSRILQLLLSHDCDPSLRDINDKRPIDLVKPNSTAYNMLLNAKEKSIKALKKEMDSLKTDGNLAQKSSNRDMAYQKYTEAISLSRRSKDLNKDAAILFTNRANVLSSMDRIQEALTDAEMAIQCNPVWQKGHWWKAKCQKVMGKYYEAFHSFMDGYQKTQSTDLVHGAAITVYLLTGKDLRSYDRLLLVDREIWPQILKRLSKDADWRAIAFLILGTNCQNMRAPEGVADPVFEFNSIPVGAACQASTRDVTLATVFDFLQKENAAAAKVGSWLDWTLLAVLNGPSPPNIRSMCVDEMDTPLHAATRFSLMTGTPAILEMLLDRYKESPDTHPELNPETLDRSGNCLYHLVAKHKYTNNALNLAELLCKRKVSAGFYNKEKKYPQHYITKKDDRRMQFLLLAASFEPMSAQQHSSDVEDEVTQSSQRDIQEINKALSKRQMQKQKIVQMIRQLPDSSSSIFNVDYTPTKHNVPKQRTSLGKASIDITEVLSPESKASRVTVPDGSAVTQDESALECERLSVSGIQTESGNDMEVNVEFRGDATPGGDSVARQPKVGNAVDRESAITEVIADKPEIKEQEKVIHKATVSNETAAMETVDVEMEGEKKTENDDYDLSISSSDDEEIEKQAEEFNIDLKMFDSMEWEVECTADVWKTLRDKHVQTELKRRIVHKIQLLASGEWLPVLCKPLKHVSPNLKLYEAKFSKGCRILWEQAIAFSPRCSETAERRLQGEGEVTHPVVGGRIYSEIIRVWDIVLDHDKIYRSVQRIVKSHSRGQNCIIQKKLKLMKNDTNQTITGKHYPNSFSESDVALDLSQERNMEMQRLFPPASANETEYHILKFYAFSSALVSHVLQNIETKVDFPFRVTDLEHAIINLESKAPILLLGRSGTGKTICCLYRLWSQFLSYWIKAREAGSPLLPRCVEFIHQETDTTENGETTKGEDEDEDDSEEGEPDNGACGSDLSPEENSQNLEVKGQEYDHLHQLFITKNAVLCSEVQKNFRELRHADDMLQAHVDHEEENLPNRLQEINDLSYPLFLTSRQLLLTLDASIGPPYFFERKDDGSLKVDIGGWTDGEGPLSILPLLEDDSDDEDVDGVEQSVYGENDGDDAVHTKSKQRKIDPRRELTYEVFVEEVWPGIKNSLKVNYHPSLIWVEIMSFIKGSYEALSKSSGCLSLEEYEQLGKKRAPNFTGARDKVYEYYKGYDHFKRQHSLFDETDLVHDMFKRLRGLTDKPWVIHQIFVDETQDFTQAELCLLISLCQNPNDMFLTGDTAQSIMRGISFRFSDLRSLFYHAQKSMQAMGKRSAVEVPEKLYQLTHNYRSHAGILSLASAVLDILVEFFPESFDRLQKDQGLFNGPKPILLESCSFGDLAVLLRGNRRKTSHIEFGAHQAILVVNDAARDAIPEELRLGLVLTIYEAKGLEFDDVLIYNFFKDSQAVKEWRVVTDFLERLTKPRDGETENFISTANLIELDADVLQADNGPRPLTFDPNSHKVLNSELKHLYTALTRARVNVWIFDEDSDKRAPMFQYFKACKLVNSLKLSDINDSNLPDAMFADKSSKQDWIKRGEDLMKKSLYHVAAKCFGMGGEEMKQKVALAQSQALTASRLKENRPQMREEFIHAAVLYLECDKPGKAALCLQNAEERKLAAQLFEKLGQFERAADIYRKMKRPLASSPCYEQLGQFNHAIEVPPHNENYDMLVKEKEKAMETTLSASFGRTAVHDDQYGYDPEPDDLEKIVEEPKARNRGKGRYRQQKGK